MFIKFKPLQYLEHLLIDTDFTVPVMHADMISIMSVYSSRNLPILPNLKIHLQSYPHNRRGVILEITKTLTNKPNYNHLGYDVYYPCLQAYIKKLNFLGI